VPWALWAVALVTAALGCAAPVIAAQGQATPAPAAPAASGPATCRVGIALTSLHALDIANETFDADFWIWSLCPDDRYTPLATMEFVNANAVTMSMEGESVVDGVHWRYARVTGTFRHEWNETDYPFDRQRLKIVMEESDAYADQFAYEPDVDGQMYEPDMRIPDWRIDGATLSADVHTYHTAYGDPAATDGTSAYARLVLSVELERYDLTGFIKLTILVYIAFVISLISYFIHPRDVALLAGRLTITSATLFAVALSLRASSADLNSGDRVTLVDWVHVAALVAILVDAVVALTTWLLVRRGRPMADVERFNRVAMIVVVVGFVTANIWLIGRAALG
jgi:hypothetical protein